MTSIVSMNSRNKGHKFEREVVNLIRDNLGIDAKRNLMQTAEGGFDVLGVPGWAVECKRYAVAKPADIKRFWLQACEQSEQGEQPVLIMKQDRKPIQVFIKWQGVGSDCFDLEDVRGLADISFDLWCCLVRERL